MLILSTRPTANKIDSITGLNATTGEDAADGEVIYDGKTYTMDADGRLVVVTAAVGETPASTKIYEGRSTATDLLDLDEVPALDYKRLETTETLDTIVFDAELGDVIYGTSEGYEADKVVAKLTVEGGETEEPAEGGEEGGEETPAATAKTYTLTPDANDISSMTLKVDATAAGEDIVLDIKFNAEEVTTAGSATVNGVEYVAVAAEADEGDSDAAATDTTLVLKATYSDSESGATLTTGTVKVTDELKATQIGETSDENVTGKTVKFSATAENANGVTVTVTDGEVTSITDLNDGETVEHDGYTYKRVVRDGVDQIIKSNSDASEIEIFDFVEAEEGSGDEANVIGLENGGGYMQITDTITLPYEGEYTSMYYGTVSPADFVASNGSAYLAHVIPADGGLYTINKNTDLADEDPALTINVTGAISQDIPSVVVNIDFAATIKAKDSATVNGVAFTVPEGYDTDLTIDSTALSATLTKGTIMVGQNSDGVNYGYGNAIGITGSDTITVAEEIGDGVNGYVFVTAGETGTEGVSEATSIIGLDVTGTVNFTDSEGSVLKTYRMDDGRLVVDEVVTVGEGDDATTETQTTKIYQGASNETDILNPDEDENITAAYNYAKLEDSEEDAGDINTLTLNADADMTIFGTDEQYTSDSAAALVTVDGTTYTVAAEAGVAGLANVKFSAAGETVTFDGFTSDNTVTVIAEAADGEYTIGDYTYTAVASTDEDGNGIAMVIAVTFEANEDDENAFDAVTTITDGVVKVKDAILTATNAGTVIVSNVDPDKENDVDSAVIVKVEGGNITSMTAVALRPTSALATKLSLPLILSIATPAKLSPLSLKLSTLSTIVTTLLIWTTALLCIMSRLIRTAAWLTLLNLTTRKPVSPTTATTQPTILQNTSRS